MGVRDLLLRARRMGFEGPFYTGVTGKLRFVLESTVSRDEIIFVATPGSPAAAHVKSVAGLEVREAQSHQELGVFAADVDHEYYPGCFDGWQAPFTWGERAMVATIEGKLAGVAWVQRGTADGFPTYYNRLLAGDARILRVGVLPSFRRRGVNSALLAATLTHLFASGATRVYIECYKRNTPSLRSFLRVGFSAVGLIQVIETPGLRSFVRWRGQDALRRTLTTYGGVTNRPASS